MIQVQQRLNYQILGSDTSPKLVFLHGIMGQGRNWLTIAKKFSKDFQCLVFDQRGHGKSFHPQKDFEFDSFSQDLDELLEFLGWSEPIYLIGHSMGGRVALDFAQKHPDRLKKLVIVDIGASSDWATMQSILEKVDFVPVPFASRHEARHFFETSFLEKFKNSMVMEFFYSNLVERNNQYNWSFSKTLVRQTLEKSRQKDHWAEFKSLGCPTLLIRGAQSTDLKKDEFDQILAHNANINGVEVPGAGHWVHAEKPRETIRIIEDFFNIAAEPKG